MILRFLLAAAFVGLAIWLVVTGYARGTDYAVLKAVSILCLVLMAALVAMRPLRWSGPFAFLVFLVPFMTAIVRAAPPANVAGVFFLLLLGAAFRGLLEHTPERVAADLHSPDPTDRTRGIGHLTFLVQERLRPQLTACDALIEAACQSEDADLRAKAEAIRDGPSGGWQDPIEALDDEVSEDFADEALNDTTDAEGGAEPPPLPPSIEESIDVLRGGEPGACRREIEALVALGEAAVPALQAATEEGNADLRIDALRALELIAQAEGTDAP